MKITQVTPGLIEIPPKGWGAIEKIIWNYKLSFERIGNPTLISYLNDVDLSSDIVHIHVANLALEAYKKGIPYIFSLHDHHVVQYGKESDLYKLNLDAIKKSIISFTHAEFLVDYFDETDKLFFLSHGVDTSLFKPKELIRKEHKLLCLANNGFANNQSEDRKGFRFAIEAAMKLDLPITIVGPENNNNFFKANTDLLNYSKLELITNNPSEEESIKIYQEHSIFLHPSILEAGHPNLTLLEALSCGLPVVGTYTGTQKLEGMIVVERDSDMIAESIKTIIGNYNQFAEDTQKTKLKYDWEVITKRLLKMYETVKIIDKNYNSSETKKLYIKEYNSTIEKKSNESINFSYHFVNNPFFEITGVSDKKFKVEFYDKEKIVHKTELSVNMWTKVSREYHTDWVIKVFTDEEQIFEYKSNFEGKRVFIVFESKSLGDTIAWLPYVLEFKKKHNCDVIVSTFWNKFFKNTYPDLELVDPGMTIHNLIAMYRIGWYDVKERQPVAPNTIPLQQTITNILGLDFKEIKPTLDFTPKSRPFTEKYITIATESTSGLKLWNNPTGWQELVDYLKSKGYRIINISKDGRKLSNVSNIKDDSIENTMNYIYHSEFLIGLSSGLSWLAWGLGKHVVMISNFTTDGHEFVSNCTRITNDSVCNGCWNNPMFKFDKGNWNWCPEHENTNRHFECHKSITSEMVIKQIQHLL